MLKENVERIFKSLILHCASFDGFQEYGLIRFIIFTPECSHSGETNRKQHLANNANFPLIIFHG